MTYPAVALGDQWAGPPFTQAADMHSRIDTPANAMADELRTWGHDFPRFFAAIGAGAQALATNVLFAASVDTAAGYNAATGVYTVPTTGLWLVTAQITQSSAVAFTLEVLGLPAGWHTPLSETSAAAAGSGAAVEAFGIDLTAGAQLSVQLQGTAPTRAAPFSSTAGAGLTTGNSPRNYFTAMLVTHR